jgi:hypothetical protein
MTTLAITIPFVESVMERRLRHFRTIFSGLGLVIGEFQELKPYNKNGRDLVVVRFDVHVESYDDGEHRREFRLNLGEFDERRRDAETILERVQKFADAKAAYDAADPTTRGEFTLKPLEVVYDSHDHFWKVYKLVPRATSTSDTSTSSAAAAIPRPRPVFR